jgi:hypothetical protein
MRGVFHSQIHKTMKNHELDKTQKWNIISIPGVTQKKNIQKYITSGKKRSIRRELFEFLFPIFFFDEFIIGMCVH